MSAAVALADRNSDPLPYAARRLVPFLLLSLLAHLASLRFFAPPTVPTEFAPLASPRLDAVLRHWPPPDAEEILPAARREAPLPGTLRMRRESDVAAPAADMRPAPEADTRPQADVDLDAARRQARAIGREKPGTPSVPLPPAAERPAVEAAIARAAPPGAWLERKENGAWIVTNGKYRCVILPRDVPLFMQGMLIVPQCG